jgi:hypothetical protein
MSIEHIQASGPANFSTSNGAGTTTAGLTTFAARLPSDNAAKVMR